MHSIAFFSLSLIFLILYSGRPAAAVALAVNPVKRGRPFDPLDCQGPLPGRIPPDFPPFANLQEMCARKEDHPRNLQCLCSGDELYCGSSTRVAVRLMIFQCYDHCRCGPVTNVMRNAFTQELNYHSAVPNAHESVSSGVEMVAPPVSPFQSQGENVPEGSNGATPSTAGNSLNTLAE